MRLLKALKGGISLMEMPLGSESFGVKQFWNRYRPT